MASDNGSTGSVVAIFAIMLLAMLGGFIAWQAGVFGDGDKQVDVNISTDKK